MTIYTATLRDYTFGCDEEWEWTGVPSFGHGAYRTPRAELAGRHGNAPRGGDWGGAGLLSWPLELLMPADPAGAEAAAMRLRAAFAPQTDNELVEMSIVMHSGTFIVRGRPLRPEVVTNELGIGNGLVQFETCDPLMYGASHSVTVAAGGTGGGMVTPMVTPMETVAGTGPPSTAVVTNDGTAGTDWTASLTGGTGGVETPRLILDGHVVEVNGTIPAGSVLHIDSRERSVLLDGNPRPWVTYASTWWQIPAGQSTFKYRAASGDGTATLMWRDAYH